MEAILRTLCFLFHEEDVLLIHGAPDKRLWPGRYNGIGGHVEPGEDVYSAARREIREETGAMFTNLRLRGVITSAPEGAEPAVVIFVFTACALSRSVRPSVEGVPVWVPWDRVGELDVLEDVPVILEWISQMEPKDPPFSAYSTRDKTGRIHLIRGN